MGEAASTEYPHSPINSFIIAPILLSTCMQSFKKDGLKYKVQQDDKF